MMLVPFADLELRMARARNARLANAAVTPAIGEPFAAEFDETDRTAFDTVQVGDFTLRYLSAAGTLAKGDLLDIGGVSYRVADLPRRIGRHEMLVGLMQERT